MAGNQFSKELIEPKTEGQLNRIRRLKACKQCHALKVRCTPVDKDDPYSLCVRCVNANKVCEIDNVELRKKRKRNPKQELEVVAQLRNEISELKRLLREKEPVANGSVANGTTTNGSMTNGALTLPMGLVSSQNHTTHSKSPLSVASDTSSPMYVTRNDLEKELCTLSEGDASLKDISNDLKTYLELRNLEFPRKKLVDVLSLNLITREDAKYRLDIYHRVLYPQNPFVQVPTNLTVDDFIREQPFLFNSIMLASGMVCKSQSYQTSLALENHTTSAVVNEIFVHGTKSPEVIKSLIILSIWYNSPECFRLRRYHIYANIAMTILHDLGFLKTNKSEAKVTVKAVSEEQNQDYRTLVLTLYLCTVSFCLILRRSIHVKWTDYVEECCTTLEQSKDPNHKNLALFARLHHQLERIYYLVHSSDAFDNNKKVSKYILNELFRELEVLKPRISPDDHTTWAYYYSVEAFLHQPLLEGLPNELNPESEKLILSLRTVEAISRCTESCLLTLQEFDKLSNESIACLPLMHFSRVVYTAGILLRLRYFILSSPSHVARELVPRHAALAILNLNNRIQETAKEYAANYFLKKMMLILLLFINTYVSQTSELLLKNNMITQLPPILKRDRKEMGYLADKMLEPSQPSMQELAHAPCLHLDLLSYAATEFREAKAKKSVEPQNSSVRESATPEANVSTYPNGIPQPSEGYPATKATKLPPFLNGSDALRRYSFGKPPYNAVGSNRTSAVPGLFLPDPNMPLKTDLVPNQPGFVDPVVATDFENDLIQRRNSVLNIDDEFWANLLGTNADSFYFAQDTTIHAENVL